MNCPHVQNLLSAFIDCELDAEEKRELRQHLFCCPECGMAYQELLDLKNYLQNMSPEPVPFDPLNVLHIRLVSEERSLIGQFSKFFWFGRVGLVTTCLGVFFLSAWLLFPIDRNFNRNLAQNTNLTVNPVSLDQEFSLDRSVTIYQASMILP